MSRHESNPSINPLGVHNPPSGDIPELTSMDGWKSVAIVESNQSLVHLNPLEKDYPIKVVPKYFINGISKASSDLYLREEATQKLVAACEFLPQGYAFVVFDSYRPLEVQQEIFNNFKRIVKASYPDKTDDELTKLTEVYVSIPSSDILKPSPHATGGAIDISIVDGNTQLLDMGTDWDSFEIESQTKHFRNQNNLFHKNRLLLYRILTSVGFANYPEEWWHYDFGNQFWGHILRRDAIYGLIEGGENYERKT